MPAHDRRPATSAPYRGPDRRGVARFSIPARLPTAILLGVAVATLLADTRISFGLSPAAAAELGTAAATLALMAGIASILQWRLDGVATGWWCGWGLIAIGVGQLALEPIRAPETVGIEVATFVTGTLLVGRAVLGPEIDTTIHLRSTLLLLAGAIAVVSPVAVAVGRSSTRADAALGVAGALWMLLAVVAAWRNRRSSPVASATWIIPMAVALGLAEVLPHVVDRSSVGTLADRWFELAAMALACVGALGGLVRAAVHHRTRALREHIEHEREVANRKRVEESFADRLHEMRSTVVAIEGGVSTLATHRDEAATSSPEATLRAALIAEIRRLRALVNESPSAGNVEVFDVEMTVTPTIALQRANGQEITLHTDGSRAALGRPQEIAQVVHGLLANAAKYAPGSPVRVTVDDDLDEIAIRIEDDGPGIDPVYWDEVFERGVRLDRSGAAEGSGLGLALARGMVRSQDGDLWLESAPSGGCAFVISLPAAPALRVVAERAEDPDMAHETRQRFTAIEEAR